MEGRQRRRIEHIEAIERGIIRLFMAEARGRAVIEHRAMAWRRSGQAKVDKIGTVATLNLQSFKATGRLELARVASNLNLDVIAIQEHGIRDGLQDSALDNTGGHKDVRIFAGKATKGPNGVGFVVRGSDVRVEEFVEYGKRTCAMRACVRGTKVYFVTHHAPVNRAKVDAHEEARRELIAALGRRRTAERVVLLGDFNAAEGSQALQWLEGMCVENGMHAPDSALTDDTWTWQGANGLRRRIDYILAGRDVMSATTTFRPEFESDHRMVQAVLYVRRENRGRPKRAGERREATRPPKNSRVEDAFAKVARGVQGERKAGAADCRSYATDDTLEAIGAAREAHARWRDARHEDEGSERTARSREEFHAWRTRAAKLLRRDRRRRTEQMASELADLAARTDPGGVRGFFNALGRLRKPRVRGTMYKDEHQRAGGASHFEKLLNDGSVPVSPPIQQPAEDTTYIQRPWRDGCEPTKAYYTDGGCTDNGKPGALSSWGVWSGTRDCDDVAMCGRTWGGRDSNVRGEITALRQALVHAKSEGHKAIEVVSDYKALDVGLQDARTRWQDGDFVDVQHGDLWREIAELSVDVRAVVRWTKGHNDALVSTNFDAYGNSRADALATAGRGEAQAEPTPVHTTRWAVEDGPPSAEETTRAIAKLKRRSAPGSDGITAEFLQDPDRAGAIQELMQVIWEEKAVPRAFQRALIVALPKVKNATEWADHRGITLLSVAGKVLTGVMLSRLQTIPVPTWQYGFRRARSTNEAIAYVRSLMDDARMSNKAQHFAFVDVSKAYDAVWRSKLWQVLAGRGVGEYMLAVLKELYDDEVSVVIDGAPAGRFSSSRGVRQGCPLSPLLFNLVLAEAMRGATLSLVAYADDMVVWASTKAELQRQLHELAGRLAGVGLSINWGKTKVMTTVASESKGMKVMKGRRGVAPVVAEDDGGPVVPGLCPRCGGTYTTTNTMRMHLRRAHHDTRTVYAVMPPAHKSAPKEAPAARAVPPKPAAKGGGGKDMALQQWVRRDGARHHCMVEGCGWSADRPVRVRAHIEIVHPDVVERERNKTKTNKNGGGDEVAGDGEGDRVGQQNQQQNQQIGRGNAGPAEAVAIEQNRQNQQIGRDDGQIVVEGKTLESVTEFKYLGRILTPDGDDKPAMRKRLQLARGAMASLKGVVYGKHGSVAARRVVWDAICMAIGTYAAETWVLTDDVTRELDSFQLAGLRAVQGRFGTRASDGTWRYPRAAETLQGALTLSEVVRRRGRRFYDKVYARGCGDPLCDRMVTAAEKGTFRGAAKAMTLRRQYPPPPSSPPPTTTAPSGQERQPHVITIRNRRVPHQQQDQSPPPSTQGHGVTPASVGQLVGL